MPNAQVVADRFHVMTQINNELDAHRKREKRNIEELIRKANSSEKAEYEKILEGLKKSKYVLLKNEKDLSEEQINKLIQVKNVSPTLKMMHELKEKIRTIFNKLIKRSAYGFRNFENFRVRCLLNWHFNC
jgi:transposase